jgi:hypothetical protein
VPAHRGDGRGLAGAVGVAPGADLRTDIPRYRIYKDGVLADEITDATPYWRDDLVAFLLGCSFTFEWALLEASIPLWHVEHGKNVAMWQTSIECRPAGAFHGPMVVSMRPIPSSQLSKAVTTSARFPERPRRAGAHRRSRRPRHQGHRQARLGRRPAVQAGRRAGVLGLRRDAPGGGPGQQAVVHAHAQPRPHVHHRRPNSSLAAF